MKKILTLVLMSIAMCFAKPDLDDVNFRIGGTFNLGFDELASGSEISFGFKMEPGIDIDVFRAGLDFELNIGWLYTENKNTTETTCYSGIYETNYCYTHNKLVEDELSILMANLKFGLPLYLQSENIGLLVEPYFIIPLGVDDEFVKLDDDTFTYSAQVAFGIRGGIRFFKYHQITIGYEQPSVKLYNESKSKIILSYSILWQKSEAKPTYTSSYSSYVPPVSASYIVTGDTTSFSSYQPDTTTYYGTYSSDRVYVRGHYRHYKSGKVSYVRPHTRSYPRRK